MGESMNRPYFEGDFELRITFWATVLAIALFITRAGGRLLHSVTCPGIQNGATGRKGSKTVFGRRIMKGSTPWQTTV